MLYPNDHSGKLHGQSVTRPIISLFLFHLLFVCLYCSNTWADYVFDFNPLLTVEEVYDDNIFLTSSDKRSDWITTILPGISSSLLHPRFNLELAYTPTLVYFLHNPQFDYTGHELNFNSTTEITSRLTFSLEENYTRSNDPGITEFVETDYERELRRDTRAIINLNSINANLDYSFGRENLLAFYYRNTNFRSEDPEEDDFKENFASSQIDYWFNVRNGITVLCDFTKGNFDTQTDLLYAFQITPRYRFRLSPHFELYGEYGYGETDFEELRLLDTSGEVIGTEDLDDYDLQQFNFGFEWQLPHNLLIEGGIGYFWRNGVGNRDDQGINSLFAIEKSTRQFTFNIGWASGSSSNYFAVRDSGFSSFWRLSTNIAYSYRDKLELNCGGSYSYNDYQDLRTTDLEEAIDFIREGRDDYRYGVRAGAAYHLLRNYLFLEDLLLEFVFVHNELDSSTDTDGYINNRFTASITATF